LVKIFYFIFKVYYDDMIALQHYKTRIQNMMDDEQI